MSVPNTIPIPSDLDPSFHQGWINSHPPAGEEIVISGVGGWYPKCGNVRELETKLFDKVDLIDDLSKRCPRPITSLLPKRIGQMPSLELFDAPFFAMGKTQARNTDIFSMSMMERTVEAVIDSGMTMEEIKGTRTGVFTTSPMVGGISQTLFQNNVSEDNIKDGWVINSAQRISHFLGVTGPAMQMDSACSTAVMLMCEAFKAIRHGDCDNALIVGSNALISQTTTSGFMKLGVLSKDGYLKSFDEKGDGYVRSEVAAAILLQKKKTAKRMYAQVMNVKSNSDGYKQESITFPSAEAQEMCFKEAYVESGVSPTNVHYVEAHGTGTLAGDSAEIKSIGNVFLNGRSDPLFIGSVKSNLGHGESAAALSSFTKAIVTFETGRIPPNLHFHTPRACLTPIVDGRMKVITEKTKFPGDYIAVNGMGFGGSNAHVILKRNPKRKINYGIPEDDLPRIVCVSSRVEDGIDPIIDDITSRPLDAEFVRLIQETFKHNIDAHYYRGYAVVDKNLTATRKRCYYDGVKRPLWFVFSGLGSQWARMGTSLMKIPIFADTIEKIDKVLSPKGIDIVALLTRDDPKMFEDNANMAVSITAMHVALIDLVNSLQIEPERFIGHSIGEISCAYYDKCVTLEQAIMCSYLFGKMSREKKNETDLVKKLKNVIPSPKRRSSKWVTTMEDEKLCRTFSAEYLVYSLSCDFVINERVPKKTIVVEITPYGHLLKLLKETFDDNILTMSLINDNEKDAIHGLLSGIGELYMNGHNPRVEVLYPKVEFPVSQGTPYISPLIRWDRKYKWHFQDFSELIIDTSTNMYQVDVSLKSDDDKYIRGHVVDGRVLYPGTGYLNLVWEMSKKNIMFGSNIILEDVKLTRATNMSESEIIQFQIDLRPSGRFEISEFDQVVATGRFRKFSSDDLEDEMTDLPNINYDPEAIQMTTKDVYKELRLHGYNYSGMFCGIKSIDVDGNVGRLEWRDNYVTFMDTMLQMMLLSTNAKELFVPVGIQKVVINETKHKEIIKHLGRGETIPVYNNKQMRIVKAGGIEIHGVDISTIARKKPLGEPVLETYKFFPNLMTNVNLEDSIRLVVQLALENVPSLIIRTAELIETVDDFEKRPPMSPMLKNAFEDLPMIQAEVNIISTALEASENGINIKNTNLEDETECLLIVLRDASKNKHLIEKSSVVLVNGGFLIAREDKTMKSLSWPDGFVVVFEHETENEKIFLLRKRTSKKYKSVVDVTQQDDFEWLPVLQASITNDPNTIVYAQNDDLSGIIGLVNCIRKEPGKENVSCVYIVDEDAPKFDTSDTFYANQLDKGLAVNVYSNGQWGTYRHLLLKQFTVATNMGYVNTTIAGDLSSLSFIESTETVGKELNIGMAEVDVYYSSLNFRDTMLATGKIPTSLMTDRKVDLDTGLLGCEFAGRLPSGKRVFGLCNGRGISPKVFSFTKTIYEVPDDWTMEDAATVALTYMTAVFCLRIFKKVHAGESILIHSGAGGVGQSAINVALYHGMKVYVTVGSQEKRDFIKSHWPEIKDNQIGNSRDCSFEQMIMRETDGQGVDYVMNALSNEKLLASVRCCKKRGTFFEIGKYDLSVNNTVQQVFIKNEVAFISALLEMLPKRDERTFYLFKKEMERALKLGYIKPIHRTVFDTDEIESALRFMTTGKHIGKILIKIREEETEKQIVAPELTLQARPRYYPSRTGSYIVVGGLGGFGLELVDWLVLRGAKHLVLTSRKGISNGYQAFRIKTWRKDGINIQVSTKDVTTFDGCRQLIEEATELAPVAGIFNLAVILQDSILENQTVDKFKTSFGPKAVATKHLDELSRRMCPRLDTFCIFSSVSCGRGNAGQTNYGMANSVMERICEKRKREGLPAIAIEWGAVGDVGLVAEMQEIDQEIEIAGTLLQRITNCLSVMDQFLPQDDPIVSSMVVAEKKACSDGASAIDVIANMLGLKDLNTVSYYATLSELGIDSITTVEIRQALERKFQLFFTPNEIRNLTFARLQEIEEKASKQEVREMVKKHDEIQIVGTFVTTVGDETTSIEPVVVFPSLAKPDCRRRCFVIPGIESLASVVEPFCRNLELIPVSIQSGFQGLESTIPSMVDVIMQHLLPQLEDSNTFILVAYSYGSTMALEAAARLEKMGRVGEIFLIDGSPLVMKMLVRGLVDVETEESFKKSAVDMIITTIIDKQYIPVVREEIANSSTWEEKIDVIYKRKSNKTNISRKYIDTVLTGMYCRITAMSQYNPNFDKLKSRITLIKPPQDLVRGVDHDYGLSALSVQPVEVVVGDGDHVSIIQDRETAGTVMAKLRVRKYI